MEIINRELLVPAIHIYVNAFLEKLNVYGSYNRLIMLSIIL